MEKKLVVRDRRNCNWIWVDKAILNGPISPASKLVYMALAYFANNTNQSCFPSYSTIMDVSGIRSRSTISKAISQLEKHSIISRQIIPGKTTIYYLLDQSKKWTSDQSTTSPLPGSSNYINKTNITKGKIKKSVDNSTPVWKQKHKIVKRGIVNKTRKELIKKGILIK